MRIIDNGDSAVATSSGLGQGEACGGPRREQDVKMQHQDKHGDKINWEISKQSKNKKIISSGDRSGHLAGHLLISI